MKIFTIILSFLFIQNTFSQVQIGYDIDGKTAGDHSGKSNCLSANGKILAIGSDENSDAAPFSGHVRVFELINNLWVQKGVDINWFNQDNHTGHSVSLSDDGLILAFSSPGANNYTGFVSVFEWDGNAWVQRGNSMIGEAVGDNFGNSISLTGDGKFLAVGGNFNDDAGNDAGHVRVFEWDGTSWIQKGADIDGKVSIDNFGSSVSISSNGNIVAVGASNSSVNGSQSGSASVYEWNGTSWVQKGIDIGGENNGDNSGRSISLSSDGNTLAIGAYNNSGNGSQAGHTRVFEWNSTAWVQKGIDIDGESAGDLSGINITLSEDGNFVAIGAINNHGSDTQSGHVRVYEWKNSSWIQKGLDIDGESQSDNFGYSVSFSSDAKILAVGAAHNADNGTLAGHVRVFDLCKNYSQTSVTACNNYSINSVNYTTSGIYVYDTLTNISSCDSLLYLNLTINTVDDSVFVIPPNITAHDSGATYQWVDCNNNYSFIAGDTNQTFIATTTGNYAVIITKNGCTDTSACTLIANVNPLNNTFEKEINVFPNPTSGKLSLLFNKDLGVNIFIEIKNILGHTTSSYNFNNTNNIELTMKEEKGMYFINIFSDKNNYAVYKIIKN